MNGLEETPTRFLTWHMAVVAVLCCGLLAGTLLNYRQSSAANERKYSAAGDPCALFPDAVAQFLTADGNSFEPAADTGTELLFTDEDEHERYIEARICDWKPKSQPMPDSPAYLRAAPLTDGLRFVIYAYRRPAHSEAAYAGLHDNTAGRELTGIGDEALVQYRLLREDVPDRDLPAEQVDDSKFVVVARDANLIFTISFQESAHTLADPPRDRLSASESRAAVVSAMKHAVNARQNRLRSAEGR